MIELSLPQIIKKLKQKEISAAEIAQLYLERIKKVDINLNSYITLNPNLISESKKSSIPTDSKPLSGIPLAIKDNFLTQALTTTASSRVLADYSPVYSATVVEKLQQAGALILGKTNMDAWAHGSSTETSDYGVTRNPFDQDRLPGGSSGGSAAAVSASLTPAAIGSETAGSIRQPSAWCGCVGLKPTYGRVSRYGVIAMGSSLDSPGPMTHNVEDAALLLEIIAGKDPNDATTSGKPVEKYTNFLKKDIKGMKIALAKNYLLPHMDSRIKESIRSALAQLERLGAQVDEVELLSPEYAIGVYTIIQRSEVSSNLGRYDGIRYGQDRSFFGEEAKRRMMLGGFSLSSGYADKYYKKAQKVRTLYIKDYQKLFQTYDAIISPTSPGPAKKIGASEGQEMFGEMEDMLLEPSSIAGLPGINLPCGMVDNLPIGMNIISPQFSEAKLIQIASNYESATEWHKIRPKMTNY